ncbi:aspartate/glutamate racemase family protein [Vibrio ishigakensis]|uniref:aspartate/glutamate racemase family protein n=1 Tax=Vibrio ishigakensis TaxID=1481914 RepID=UPI0021C47C6F|nr:amino acid racemase [Vibrio ishigakensis]
MKKLGLIGGTSWHSTLEYYSDINQGVNEHYKSNTNPPLRLINLNQKQLHDLQRENDWDAIANIFGEAAIELESVSVDAIALCANTPHKVFDQLQQSVSCPIIHIADAIGEHLNANEFQKVGLLGTRFTMSEDFIKGRLSAEYEITTLVPSKAEQEQIQQLLYSKLSIGVYDDETREIFLKVINNLAEQGAQAVILGCTEFPLLLKDSKSPIPVVDSLQCHTKSLISFILSD